MEASGKGKGDMADNAKAQGIYCCAPIISGFRMLSFPYGTQSGVLGLNEIFANIYNEGREVDVNIAEEITNRLTVKNYIAPSSRQKYCDPLMTEYKIYAGGQAKNNEKKCDSCKPPPDTCRKRGLLFRLFKGQ
ncbi:MAG: hypothetical protein NT178_07945 [Proteobacteria bacterium]|nr:hypothetical protein [Pseudomonadota bacterium]